MCGNCQCKSRRGDLPLIYTGRWCECDDSRCPSFNGAVCGGKMLKNTKNKSFVYLNYLSVFATKDGTGAIEEEQGYATFNNISVISWRSVLFV